MLVSGGSDWHGHYPEAPYGAWRPPRQELEPLLQRLGLSLPLGASDPTAL